MFKLTQGELDAARDAIDTHGYSIYIPTPPEWKTVKDNWSAISSYLLALDLDLYQPRTPLRVYAPKSRINLRPVVLLHPFDLLIYTALTLLAKRDIEAARIAVSENRVFSNRASSKPTRLFSRSTIERRRRAGSFPIPELPSIDERPRWSRQAVERYLASSNEGMRPRRGRPSRRG